MAEPRAQTLAGATLMLASSSACAEPFPIEYESEHFRYGSGLDRPLCEGDLRDYESIAQRAADTLSLSLDGVTDVYIWENSEWSPVLAEKWCGNDVSGCYSYDTKTIYTKDRSLTHELVHAAVNAPKTPTVISEGVAEAFSGSQTRFAISLPSTNIGRTSSDIDLLTATHFVHWLLYKWDPEKLGRMFGGGSDLRDNFEAVYGVPLTEAELDYLAEAPAAYPAIGSCEAPPFPYDDDARTWSLGLTLECTDETTRADSRGLYTSHVVEVEEGGRYNLSVGEGTWIRAYPCTTEPVETLLPFEEFMALDFPPDWTGFPNGTARLLLGPFFDTVELEPGPYVFRVGIEGYEPGEVEFALWPALSPSTEVPDD